MRRHKEARNGIGRTVLSTMPVVARSLTYSSERVGDIEAHENKQLSMAWDLSYCSILVTTHANFVSRWMVIMFTWLPL